MVLLCIVLGGWGAFCVYGIQLWDVNYIHMQCLGKLCTYQCYAPLPLVDGDYMGGLSEDSAPIVGNSI